MEKDELKDKVSLVTGASRGVGKAITLKLAALGARVAINYLSSDREAAALAERIKGMGGEAVLARADVADGGAVKAMIREIVGQWGKIDILVNNAGIVKDDLLPRMSEQTWDAVLDTNLRGAYLCTNLRRVPCWNRGGGG